nr:hypothetical protein CFP56_09583 [Quercus suber]
MEGVFDFDPRTDNADSLDIGGGTYRKLCSHYLRWGTCPTWPISSRENPPYIVRVLELSMVCCIFSQDVVYPGRANDAIGPKMLRLRSRQRRAAGAESAGVVLAVHLHVNCHTAV